MPRDNGLAELIEERPAAVEARATSTTPQPDAAAAAYGTEPPPWIAPPNSSQVEWETFTRYPNYLAAHIVAGLFENEGLPSIVVAWTSLPGVGSAAVKVPKSLMHRARWIASLAPTTDAELLFLATGELSPEVESE